MDVQLGICDEAMPREAEVTEGYWVNKIGGTCAWPGAQPGLGEGHADPRGECDGCGRDMALVLQVYAPVEGSMYHRVLYIMVCAGCPAADGADAWKVCRTQFEDPSTMASTQSALEPKHKATAAAVPSTSTSGWGVADVDDWGDAEGEEEWGAGDSTVKATTMDEPAAAQPDIESHKAAPNRTAPTLPDPLLGEEHPARLQCYYLNVVPEPPPPPKMADDFSHESELLKKFIASGGVVPSLHGNGQAVVTERGDAGTSASADGAAEERYEKVTPKHGDLAFHHFKKRIGRLPEQCVRYGLGAPPLVVSDRASPPIPSAADVAGCPLCGGRRQPEIQLLPALLCHLAPVTPGMAVPSFGTVVVYTCERHCWNGRSTGDVAAEVAFAQADADDANLSALLESSLHME